MAGGNGLPVLEPGHQVLHLMALLLQPLAVRELLRFRLDGMQGGVPCSSTMAPILLLSDP